MKAVAGHHEICERIAEIFGIQHCRRLEIKMEVNKVVTVLAEFYPEEDQLNKAETILKEYGLHIE